LRVGSESFGCQVQQPGTHNTSVPPQFSNLGEVETEFSFPVQQGKAFGISLHQTVFNPVVHHFDEVPRSNRPDMRPTSIRGGGKTWKESPKPFTSLCRPTDHEAIPFA